MALRDRRVRRERVDVVALVRELGGLLGELDVSEIEIDHEGLRIRVQRGSPTTVSPAVAVPMPAQTIGAPIAIPADTAAPGHVSIEAPMVGTFYRASSPTADPYVQEGDVVKQGQILCIIEAMKLMNEIESKASGRIVKILVENAQPVEYGQPLFLIGSNA